MSATSLPGKHTSAPAALHKPQWQQHTRIQDPQHLRSGQWYQTPYLSFPAAQSRALTAHSSAAVRGMPLHKLQNPFKPQLQESIQCVYKISFHADSQKPFPTDDSSFRTTHHPHCCSRDVMRYALYLCVCVCACVWVCQRKRWCVCDFPRQSGCVSTSLSCLQSSKERKENSSVMIRWSKTTHTHVNTHSQSWGSSVATRPKTKSLDDLIFSPCCLVTFHP